MEPIISYVKRRLRDVGPAEWDAIGTHLGFNKTTTRKLAYERNNPGITTVEPLYRYFLSRDYGTCQLPHEKPPITKRGR
jgi:hypothetical protein